MAEIETGGARTLSPPAAASDDEASGDRPAASPGRNLGQLLSALREGDARGDPVSAYRLGLLHMATGEHALAFPFFLKAALAGQPEAMMEVANAYGQGIGVEKDVAKCVFWGGTAAKHGLRPAIAACEKSGIDYGSEDFGLTPENLLLQGYFRRETQAVGGMAQRPAATTHQCPPKGGSRLRDWARGAAAGCRECLFNLGMARYIVGKYEESAALFLEAALQGQVTAQYMLARQYAAAQGVPGNEGRARYWMGTAAQAGDDAARSYCEKNGWNFSSASFGLTPSNLHDQGYGP